MKHNIYTPKTGWIVVDDSGPVDNKAPYIGGFPMNEKSIKDAKHVFTKRDRAMGKNRTVRDVDRALDGFQARYPHLKRPDRVRRDPFPEVKINDHRKNNPE